MTPWQRRAAQKQNERLITPTEFMCICGASSREHEPASGDPFDGTPHACKRTGCADFTRCHCRPCDCEDGQIVTEWEHFPGDNNLGGNCATSRAVATAVCPKCKGTSVDKRECAHGLVQLVDAIEVDGGR